MARAGRGHIRWFSDGRVETFKGTPVSRIITYRGRRYSLTGATGSRREAESSARRYRERFGNAIVRKIEPGNFGVYAGGSFGK